MSQSSDVRRLRSLALLTGAVLAGASSARGEDKVTFQDHVLPVFKNACLNCHNPDKKRADLDLSNYAGTMAGGGSGKVIEPGDPDGSLLFRLVTHAEEPAMPPKADKLSEKDLATIKSWIAGGVLETSGSTAVASNKPKVDLKVVAATGKPDGPPPMPGDLLLEPPVHTSRPGAVLAMASSPWAPLVAVGGQKQVLLYNPQTRELLGVLPFPEGFPNVLKFSRSGKLLLVAGGVGAKSGKAVLFDVESGNRITEVGDELDAVLAADISPDQSLVALGGPGKMVKLYSTASGAMVGKVKKHTDWVTAIAFSPDGVLLATGDRNGGLFVWEADGLNEFHNLPGHKAAVTDAAFRGDANVLATAGEDGELKLWNMLDGKPVKNVKSHGAGVLSVDFAPDGRLVTAGRDNRLRTWKPDVSPIKAYKEFPDVALHAVFDNSDGGKLAVGADWTGEVRVYDVESGNALGTLDANPPAIDERIAQATIQLTTAQAEAGTLAAQLIAAHTALDVATTDKQQLDSAVSLFAKAAAEAQARLGAAAQARPQAAAAYEAALADAKSKRGESDRLLQSSLQAKALLDTAEAEYDALTQDLTARQTAAAGATDFAAKAKAAADAAPQDAGLAKAAADAKSAADLAAAQLAEAQKALAAKSEQLKSLGDAAVKGLGDATAAAEARKAAQQAADAARHATEQAAAAPAEASAALASAQRAKAAAEAALPKAAERVTTLAANIEKLKPRVEQAAAEASRVKQQIARLQAGQFFTKVYAARQDLSARQAEADKSAAEAHAAQAAAEKAAADVPAFEKRMAEFPKALAAAQAAVPLAEQSATAAANLAKGLVEIAAQRDAFQKESAGHAAKVAELASRDTSNKLLADAAAAAKSSADLLAAELEKVKEGVKSRERAAKDAADALAAARAAMEKEKLDQQNAAQTLAAMRAAVPTAQATAAEKKSAAEAASSRLAEAKAKAEQLATQYAELKKQLGLQLASR